MQLCGYDFSEASAIDAARGHDGALLAYTAHDRYENVAGHPLFKFGEGPFVRLRLARLPAEPGVYAVTSAESVRYVGMATISIAARWSATNYGVIHPRNCFRGGQATNVRINHFIYNALAANEVLTLWVHLTSEPSRVEDKIIDALQPPWNRRGLRP